MKKLIALIAVLAIVLSLTGCLGTSTSSVKVDPDNTSDLDEYSRDFDGLKDYFEDLGLTDVNDRLEYDILGADDGVRYVLNNNAYIEVYDFSVLLDNPASSDSADPDKARTVLDDVKEKGKFTPMDNGVELKAVITDSGNIVIAWDESRKYDYEKDIVTEDVLEYW